MVYRGGGLFAVKSDNALKNQAAYIFAKWLTLRPGEILVMPSGSYQEFYSTTDAGSLFFLLKPDSVWGEPEFRHAKSENNELICLLMEKVAAISDSKAPENFSVAMGQTIFHLLREELHQSGDGRTIFQQLKNKMQLYPQKQWSVEKMAEACGVSTSYFFTLCPTKAHTDSTEPWTRYRTGCSSRSPTRSAGKPARSFRHSEALPTGNPKR